MARVMNYGLNSQSARLLCQLFKLEILEIGKVCGEKDSVKRLRFLCDLFVTPRDSFVTPGDSTSDSRMKSFSLI